MTDRIDLKHQTFGKLYVLEYAGRDKTGHVLWRCMCECGNITVTASTNLLREQASACRSCSLTDDLTGKTFGNWTVIGKSGNKTKGGEPYWQVTCVCGNGEGKEIVGSGLKRGKNLGCKKCKKEKSQTGKKHGLYDHPLYRRYISIYSRCYTTKNGRYKDYGGRGIYIDSRWLGHPEVFIKDCIEELGWILEINHYDLDRRDNDGPYSLLNCRFVDKQTNCSNKRNNKWVEVKGQIMTLAQAIRKYAVIPKPTVISRLKRGWRIEEALFTPANIDSRPKTRKIRMDKDGN